jgi:tRNA nucleotidyltransferase (CCA-adding enzyme)
MGRRKRVSRTAQLLTRPSLTALRRALPSPLRGPLDAAIAAAEAARLPLWAVGGPIRDLAAGLPVRDLDLATTDATALATRVASTLGARAHDEPRFLTASVEGDRWRLDLATLRTEHYVRPGALPTVRQAATIEADLARRDFSVNAMALPLVPSAGRGLIDPRGGLEDLRARRLHVLHTASFRDDATRLWRAARFAARLRLKPDRETAQLIEEGRVWLPVISARRLWREFARVAAEPRADAAVRLLDRWGILAAAHPALAPTEAARIALRHLRGPIDPDALLALLLAPAAPTARVDAATRLGAPRTATLAVEDAALLLALAATDEGPDEGALRLASGAAEAARAAVATLAPDRRAFLRALARWEHTRSPLTPAEVIALGIPSGPALGAALAELRRARYLGTLKGVPAARRLVRMWAAQGLPAR